jgi:hypothetical protein
MANSGCCRDSRLRSRSDIWTNTALPSIVSSRITFGYCLKTSPKCIRAPRAVRVTTYCFFGAAELADGRFREARSSIRRISSPVLSTRSRSMTACHCITRADLGCNQQTLFQREGSSNCNVRRVYYITAFFTCAFFTGLCSIYVTVLKVQSANPPPHILTRSLASVYDS